MATNVLETFTVNAMRFLIFLHRKLAKGMYARIELFIEDGEIVRWSFNRIYKPEDVKQ